MDFTPDDGCDPADELELEEPRVGFDSIFGIEVEPLRDEQLASAVIVIVKTVGPNMNVPGLSIRWSEDLASWEVLGLLKAALASAEVNYLDEAVTCYLNDDEDEDDD